MTESATDLQPSPFQIACDLPDDIRASLLRFTNSSDKSWLIFLTSPKGWNLFDYRPKLIEMIDRDGMISRLILTPLGTRVVYILNRYV